MLESRSFEDGIRRRRECLSGSCGVRFTTAEVVVRVDECPEDYKRVMNVSSILDEQVVIQARAIAQGILE